MVSERVQRRIDRLLDDAEEAADRHDWAKVIEVSEGVLAVDPDNPDANALIEIARRAAAARVDAPSSESVSEASGAPSDAEPVLAISADALSAPSSFANDRYQVSKFLGEGGKKRVYQAHDNLLDREVAFA